MPMAMRIANTADMSMHYYEQIELNKLPNTRRTHTPHNRIQHANEKRL